MTAELTKKQKLILDFINDFQGKNGFPPTVRDICLGVGLRSTATVFTHLKNLEEKGFLNKSSSKNRAISVVKNQEPAPQPKLTATNSNAVEVPILGNVAAGEPIWANENFDNTMTIPVELTNHKQVFMVVVQGTSMIQKGILPGDYLSVSRQSTAENGEIVVALLGDSVTVKTFYKEDGYVRLQPENDTMEPIIIADPTELKILGKVIGLIRKF
ncbi:MAG: transcriptional repressor LexA [Clostridia bacterium]|nr:transcriptional repressor LexA [Clostridia bacterium]